MPAGTRDRGGSLEHGRFQSTRGALDITRESTSSARLTLAPLVGIMYFTVCGGTFGIEARSARRVRSRLGLLLLFIMPLIFSIPSCSWSTR